MSLPRGAVGRYVVCDCGISWSYSLAYGIIAPDNTLSVLSQTKCICGVDFNGDISFPKTGMMINVTLPLSHSSISFLKLVYVMYRR